MIKSFRQLSQIIQDNPEKWEYVKNSIYYKDLEITWVNKPVDNEEDFEEYVYVRCGKPGSERTFKPNGKTFHYLKRAVEAVGKYYKHHYHNTDRILDDISCRLEA